MILHIHAFLVAEGHLCLSCVQTLPVYIVGKKFSLGLSLDRPGKLITNLTARPAPKNSRKNGSV